MIRASNISLYKILTAGYISVEAYAMLNPKTRFYELFLNNSLLYPDYIVTEIKQLRDDAVKYEAICGLEQMEFCLFNNDKRPYELLESLLLSSGEKVTDFLSSTGAKFFLLDYVFCNKDSLRNRAFINVDNITVIKDFIVKYENAFTRLITTGKFEQNIMTKESMSYNDYLNTIESTENHIVGEHSDLYAVQDTSSRMKLYPIDQDAVSLENAVLKKYVLILSQLTDDEFEPFKLYFESQLVNASIRLINRIKSVGYHEFYINYLFAEEEKLLSIPKFGKKSVYDFRKIRKLLIKHVVNSIDSLNADLKSTEEGETAISGEIQQKQHLQNLPLKEIIGDTHYAVLSKILYGLTQELSVRGKNAINNYKGDFIEDFVHKNWNIMNLRNIGRKTAEEIFAVVRKLKVYVEEAKLKTSEEISPENLHVMEYEMFFDYCWDDFSCQYFLEKGHLPMFHILENWLTKQEGKEWYILKSCLPLYTCKQDTKTLDEVAKEYSLTRERCRQLCVKCIKKFCEVEDKELLSTSINLARIMTKTEEWQYLTEAISCNNLLEIGIVYPYIVEERCGFSQEFCFFILSILLANEYSLVGRELISLSTRVKQIWNNSYLIKSEYADAFNFNEVPALIDETESNLTADVAVDAEQLVIDTFFTAWNYFDTDKVYAISDILSHILIKECGKIPNDNFQFTLESKKIINITDVIYSILRKNANPMTTEEIFVELERVCPGKSKSPESIKIRVANDPRICMIGKAGLVGLLEWQHVKIGSIRDIIVQYLSKFDEPQPAAKIVEHVQKYRDTTESSIRSSMGSGDQFVQFSGGLYGLKDKNYAIWYNAPEKKRNFSLRVNEIEIFLRENLHFPFNQSDSAFENSLYNWWKRIVKSDELSEEQRAEVRRIQDQYKDYPVTRRDNEWYELHRKYKAFLQNYSRKPQRNNPYEKPLYIWFERCMDDFSEGKLSLRQEKLYIELCKLL